MGSHEAPAHRKVAFLGWFLLLLMTVVGGLGAIAVRSIQRDLRVLAVDDGQVLSELQRVQHLVIQGQLALEQAATTSSGERAQLLAHFDAALGAAAPRPGGPPASQGPGDAAQAQAFDEWVADASALRAQLAAGDGDVNLSEVRASFETLTGSFEAGIVPLAQTVEAAARDASHRADVARDVLFVVVVVGLVVGTVVSRSSYRAAVAQHAEISLRDRQRSVEAARHRVEFRVARALDFARSDREALGAAEAALAELHPQRPGELLLADSSRSRFEVGFRTHRDEGLPGCAVSTPADCPAVAKGHALVFETSERFDACPYLKGRPSGPVSAVCIPVSIGGISDGVLHSTGGDGETVAADVRHALDVVASRAGDRLTSLRAFERSEAQAATDPLTGLANRRSFEVRVGAMLRDGTPVAIAFGDLDHFKQRNDAHGHDAGDSALRAFAHAFRNVVRPGDVVARWGGDEVVAAFPSTSSGDVVKILERLQLELAAVATGGSVAPFTVSFGVADRRDGDDLESLVAAADRGLLAAKARGRDRIVLAATVTSETTATGAATRVGLTPPG